MANAGYKAMKEVIVSLRIFSDDLDPDDVTTILKIEPTSQCKRGDRISKFSAADKTHKNGHWALERSGLPAEFGALLRGFLRLVPETQLQLLNDMHTSQDIFVGLFGIRDQSSLDIDPDILEKIGSRGWPLIFDMYIEGDD
jgi:hypothetical protein